MTKLPLPLCFCAAALWAQSPATPVDVKAMDPSADPCTDIYQYACGSWMKNNPIPADQSRWGRFTELEERNRETLHRILEEQCTQSQGARRLSAR